MKNDLNITVIGAGISGLTTALVLSEEGYQVDIISKELPADTTSAIAAAIWFPYKAYPREKVEKWSLESFHTFEKLAETEKSGVSFIPFTAYVEPFEKPWWLKALPQSHILDEKVSSPIHPNNTGYTLNVPLIETPIYLDYLIWRLKKSDVDITQKEIHSLDNLGTANLIINCTGLGAQKLFGDNQLYPIQGQVVQIDPIENVTGFAVEYPIVEQDDETAYLIPRRDCLVLGGSSKKNEFSTTPDADLSKKILAYCAEFQPKVKLSAIQRTLVGLRPGRAKIRLEKDPDLPLIHNYGHGGAGFTVSWGCAYEVLAILKNIQN